MSGVGRASVLIGAGTVVSRLTGFLQKIFLVGAIGSVSSRAADAFTVANTLPNNIFAIISTGILTAVIVPQIVRAGSHDDGGRSFISKLLTLGTVVLVATTAIAMVAAPWLVQLYAREFTPQQLALSTAFAYWCLPQILFYGVYALVGEILHARNVYGPYTWAPIVNNVVSIVGLGAFIALFGLKTSADGWNHGMIALIGGTATLGIAVQAGILLIFWRRAGLQLRPDFRWRGVGLRHIGRLAGWTFLMVVAGQIAGIVQSRVLSGASGHGPAQTTSGYAWLLFMLPYSIIVLSIGTPYFTRMSEHAHAGRHDEVRADVGRSIRTLGVFIVIATAALAVAAVPASRMVTTDRADAAAAALVLLAFLVSLLPLAVLFVIQRTFYAYDDTRTPFWFTLVQCALVVVAALVAQTWVPTEYLAAGVALGQSVASVVQVVIATWLLRRKIGDIGVGSWMLALGRFALAALPAAGAGWLAFLLLGGTGGWTLSEKWFGAVGAAIVGVVSVVVYVGVLALLRAPELAPAMAMARRLLSGRR